MYILGFGSGNDFGVGIGLAFGGTGR